MLGILQNPGRLPGNPATPQPLKSRGYLGYLGAPAVIDYDALRAKNKNNVNKKNNVYINNSCVISITPKQMHFKGIEFCVLDGTQRGNELKLFANNTNNTIFKNLDPKLCPRYRR